MLCKYSCLPLDGSAGAPISSAIFASSSSEVLPSIIFLPIPSLNEEYPRYLTDKNMVKVEEEVDEDVDITDEEQVYTGNIFKDFSEK